MATATVTLTATSAAMVFEDRPNLNENGPKIYQIAPTSDLPGIRHLLFNFSEYPENMKFNKILDATLYVQAGEIKHQAVFYVYAISNFDPQTITWNELKGYEKYYVSGAEGIYEYQANTEVHFGRQIPSQTQAILENGAINIWDNGQSSILPPTEIYGGANNKWPRLVVDYDDAYIVPLVVKYAGGPRAGESADRKLPITFSWSTQRPEGEYSAKKQSQSNAVFQWRVGVTGEWTDVKPAETTDNFVTIPAYTFPISDYLQWRVRVTGSSGNIYDSEYIYYFETEDKEAIATPAEPKNTVEDGNAPIIFRWTVRNQTGTTPTGADLQRWASNAWVDMAHVDGPDTTYAAPANTFTAGTNYWRVRAYNADGVAGPWSAYATFTVVAAPLAPTVSAEAVPFAVIRWQVNGQQAWRATVDGKAYGPYFGTEKTFTLPDFLADGEHTVTVEVQGQYGLWSEPGSYTFTVENQPGDQLSLQGAFGIDAALIWYPPSPINDYLIYRDGVQIGHTTARAFADRIVQGEHEWFVINRLPGGYYSRSNTVQGELSTDQIALALLSGGDWIQLEKTASPTRMESYTVSQTVELFHLAGQEYPEAEASPYKTMQGSFAVAWNLAERAQAADFEALIGKPIIYKAPAGETLVGVLQAWSKQTVHFYRAYSATVQRIHWRDYVEAD